jgi:hypothetical protein
MCVEMAGKMFDVSPRQRYELLESEQIPAVRLGGITTVAALLCLGDMDE